MEGACCTACTRNGANDGLTMGDGLAAGVSSVSSNTFGLSSNLEWGQNARMETQPGQWGSKEILQGGAVGACRGAASQARGESGEQLWKACCPLLFVLPPALVCLAVKQVATRSGPAIQRCRTGSTPPTRNRTQRGDSWFQSWLAFMVCVICSWANTLDPSVLSC
jgi:hypothetical protein